jgi:hypothetical protein
MGKDARILSARAGLTCLAFLAFGCRLEPPPPAPQAASVPEVTAAVPERRVLVLSTTQPGRIEAF